MKRCSRVHNRGIGRQCADHVLDGPIEGHHRDLITSLAARHLFPNVSASRYYVAAGGLASYGVDHLDLYRRAAGYVDRVLKGEMPANLPVQHADKFELVINVKTAKMLGLERRWGLWLAGVPAERRGCWRGRPAARFNG
jgi:ABC transporter substrate binding protein